MLSSGQTSQELGEEEAVHNKDKMIGLSNQVEIRQIESEDGD